MCSLKFTVHHLPQGERRHSNRQPKGKSRWMSKDAWADAEMLMVWKWRNIASLRGMSWDWRKKWWSSNEQMFLSQSPHTSAACLCHLGQAVQTHKIWFFKHIRSTCSNGGAGHRHTHCEEKCYILKFAHSINNCSGSNRGIYNNIVHT